MSLKIYIIYVNTKVPEFIFFGLNILSPLNHSESTDFFYVVPLSSLRKKSFVHLGVLFELHNSKTKYYSLLLNKINPIGLHVYSLAKQKGFHAVFQSIAFIISFY